MAALPKLLRIATRGSALALAQSGWIRSQCQQAFPQSQFELKIIKTTGDKLQSAPPPPGSTVFTQPSAISTKGLFTKELELALLSGEADLAVHSLKDLPTELPAGLALGAVSPRQDPRDLLICRTASLCETVGNAQALGAFSLRDLRPNAAIATTSTRRAAQLLAIRPDFRIAPMRGNVGTRLKKLADRTEFDALALAAAGLIRLGYQINSEGRLAAGANAVEPAPEGLAAIYLSLDEMLPCVGQAALGIEIRASDSAAAAVCARVNDPIIFQCVAAERAFLRAMGGGCLSPIAAYASPRDGQVWLRGLWFDEGNCRRGEAAQPLDRPAEALGEALAAQLRAR